MTNAMSPPALRAADPVYAHVLVPLDGSDLAAGAVSAACALGNRFGATVHTITVADSADDVDELRASAARALGVDASDPAVHVEVSAHAARAIRRRADELGSCLVCMSSHGRSGMAGSFMGSVTAAVLKRGRAPMVVVGVSAALPSHESVMPPLTGDHVIACVDGGPVSERVLAVAAAWCHALGMDLSIVTVAEPMPAPVRIPATWHRHHGPDADADEYVRNLAAFWSTGVPEVHGEVVYDPIGVGSGMKDYLREHPTGLVAITTHARAGLEGVMLGRGAAEIIRASAAPVLVVPLAS